MIVTWTSTPLSPLLCRMSDWFSTTRTGDYDILLLLFISTMSECSPSGFGRHLKAQKVAKVAFRPFGATLAPPECVVCLGSAGSGPSMRSASLRSFRGFVVVRDMILCNLVKKRQ